MVTGAVVLFAIPLKQTGVPSPAVASRPVTASAGNAHSLARNIPPTASLVPRYGVALGLKN